MNITYTPEQVATITEQYKAGTSVETIAANAGRTVNSVIAKLAKEGVYISKAKLAAATAKPPRPKKADLIVEMATELGVTEDKLESLEKATVEALQIVINALRKS